jgi:hypothetical protein
VSGLTSSSLRLNGVISACGPVVLSGQELSDTKRIMPNTILINLSDLIGDEINMNYFGAGEVFLKVRSGKFGGCKSTKVLRPFLFFLI